MLTWHGPKVKDHLEGITAAMVELSNGLKLWWIFLIPKLEGLQRAFQVSLLAIT